MLAKTMTDRQRYWLTHINAVEYFDGSIADYARTHQLSIRDVYNWRSKLTKLGIWQPADKAPDFIQVKQTNNDESSSVSSCTVTFSNGSRLELQGEISESILGIVLNRMESSH